MNVGKRKAASKAPTLQAVTPLPAGQGPVLVTNPPLTLAETMVNGLGIPARVVDLILNTTYETGNGPKPLFGVAPSSNYPGRWVYNGQEIQEVVRIWDLFKGAYVATGTIEDPVPTPYTSVPANLVTNSDDDAFVQFAAHIEAIMLSKTRKARKNLLVKDDSVFDSPFLAEYRKEETIKNALLNRKRKPIPGRCPRCPSTEIFQEEKFLRAGDEGGVFISKCARCEYEWKS